MRGSIPTIPNNCMLGKRVSACIFYTGRRKTQRKEREVSITAVLVGRKVGVKLFQRRQKGAAT
jgi:hypothetical protein